MRCTATQRCAQAADVSTALITGLIALHGTRASADLLYDKAFQEGPLFKVSLSYLRGDLLERLSRVKHALDTKLLRSCALGTSEIFQEVVETFGV